MAVPEIVEKKPAGLALLRLALETTRAAQFVEMESSPQRNNAMTETMSQMMDAARLVSPRSDLLVMSSPLPRALPDAEMEFNPLLKNVMTTTLPQEMAVLKFVAQRALLNCLL